MTAIVLTAAGPQVDSSWQPPPAEQEAVVRLSLAGICATDLELIKGYMGFRGVLGHEWVGVVESAPASARQWLGRRVVGEINCPCRVCTTCRGGHPTHCPHRTVVGIAGRHGVFSNRFTLPVANLHEVPRSVPDEAAVFVEPLAAACQITEQVEIRPTMSVVILGLGRLGQLIARVLALTGARVIGISRSQLRRELAPPGVITAPPDALTSGGPDALAPDKTGFDVVVDCTGAVEGIALATQIVRPRGTIVLKTTTASSLAHPPTAPHLTDWVINEVTVVGSRCGPFAPALRLLESGLVDPTALVTDRMALADGVAALARASRPTSVKVLLMPHPET